MSTYANILKRYSHVKPILQHLHIYGLPIMAGARKMNLIDIHYISENLNENLINPIVILIDQILLVYEGLFIVRKFIWEKTIHSVTIQIIHNSFSRPKCCVSSTLLGKYKKNRSISALSYTWIQSIFNNINPLGSANKTSRKLRIVVNE